MTALVIGASAGLGRELATALAAAGDDLVVVSSDERDLAALAADLGLRFGVTVVPIVADVGSSDAYLEEVQVALRRLGGARALLFPVGVAREDDDGSLAAEPLLWIVRVNFTSVLAAIAKLVPDLMPSRATIVGFGSVAAARGRGRNVAYAAAKRALETSFESLAHRYAGVVRVQFYILGYLATERVVARTLVPKADPRALARRVVRDLDADFRTRYHPAWWRAVAIVVRWLPWPIFRRLSF